MEIGQFEIEIKNEEIGQIVAEITGEPVKSIRQVCEQYGDEAEEVRYYDVYIVETASAKKVLKKAGKREFFNYETYLKNRDFPVPAYYGKCHRGDDDWILIEHIDGTDLRDMTDEIAIAAADSLTTIQNAFWEEPDGADDRFLVYQNRIQKRYQYLVEHGEKLLGEAYKLFLERQKTAPRTLANGDFLQFNVVSHDGKVTIIDWGFGGKMPYSLDIARFIAHGTEDRATFPFYMTDGQKKLFLDRVYEQLKQKPDRKQFITDVKLAVLNEYVEFVEAEEDEGNWYYDHAAALAKELLEG